MVVISKVKIKVGGEGCVLDFEISGSKERCSDLMSELVPFVNTWISQRQVSDLKGSPKPCSGCGDK